MESPCERALREIGQNGKFQKRFDIIYNVVLPVLWVMAYNNIILALAVTPHMCKLPDKPVNVSEYTWKKQHIPMIGDTTEKTKFSECLVYLGNESNDSVDCNDYTYDKTWYETTIPSDNNWVCNKELNVANVFAYSKIVEALGSLVFGWFGDIYGRKPTYIISLMLLIAGRFLSLIASKSYILFALGCSIASFPSWSTLQSTAIISLEISSSERRAKIAKLRLIASSFGMFLMPFFYWWLRNWKSFMIVTTVTQLPYLILSWKIIESPQWLWVNNKLNACVEQLQFIAKINNTNLDPDNKKEILNFQFTDSSKTKVLGPLALFSGVRLTILTILQLLLWISVSINYTTVLMTSGEKTDGNPFLEFAWQSLAEVPGFVIAAWLVDRVGRRYTGVISYATTAFLWSIHSFRSTSTSEWLKNGWLSTVTVIVNRFTISISYYTINLLNMELYPICLRQSGMSLGNVISSASSALTPYVLFLGRRFDPRYPGAILAMISLIGVACSYILPETLNAKLPETMDEARNFGRNKHSEYSTDVKANETRSCL